MSNISEICEDKKLIFLELGRREIALYDNLNFIIVASLFVELPCLEHPKKCSLSKQIRTRDFECIRNLLKMQQNVKLRKKQKIMNQT